MSVNIPRLGEEVLHTYRYDQLNRIKEVNNYKEYNATYNTWVSTDEHKEDLSFDANGNIKTAILNGDASQLFHENFNYTYHAQKKNRLLSITNLANSTTYNYQYDEIGNATRDELEGNAELQWNVYGKLSRVVKTNGTVIDYAYDAGGNRISKTVGGKVTWYIRDAGGNIMATYLKDVAVNSGKLSTEAFHLYGSSMLGRHKKVIDVESISVPSVTSLTRDEKEYYFSNHLGNNLLVLSDRKTQHSTNGTTVDYYNPVVVSATDYSAYGESLIGREFNGSGIKYGFNGKLNDEDAGYQDYGMRWYSKKARRFPSVDPLTKKYPELTPYQFASNTPIQAIDLDGAEAFFVHGTWANNSFWNNDAMAAISSSLGIGAMNWSSWSGNNNRFARVSAAQVLAKQVAEMRAVSTAEPLALIGHSHGGSVAIEAANILQKQYGIVVDYLITVNTPVVDFHQLDESLKGKTQHINIYNKLDAIQIVGGGDIYIKDNDDAANEKKAEQGKMKWKEANGDIGEQPGTGEVGVAGRQYSKTVNIAYEDQFDDGSCSWSNHCGQEIENVRVWVPKLKDRVLPPWNPVAPKPAAKPVIQTGITSQSQ